VTTRISLDVLIEASPSEVWAELECIERHVEWMRDAVRIKFVTSQQSGLGTRFSCLTKVGPIKLTDHMEIVRWTDRQLIGVHHVGLVRGTGDLSLQPAFGGGTIVRWDETLQFPWWLGGCLGEMIGRPALTRIWRSNLVRLKAIMER
jgi:hypothetical protein